MTKREIRSRFRSQVLERDGHRCRKCGATGVELDAHHITPRERMPAGGYVVENGITLCTDAANGCHSKAESAIRDSHGEWSPSGLYELIGSSEAAARAASERLFIRTLRGP